MVFDPGGTLPTPVRETNERFRFGSFNHARKLSDATIDLFCAVMMACPNSELVLKSISFHEEAEQSRIRRRFERAGLDPKRLILLKSIEGGINHLQLYSQMDVALDPIPYGGATTTAEALWMGVPVISLKGKGMVGRLSASLLNYSGCEEWIANNIDSYVNIAKKLAAQGNRSSIKRMLLRNKLKVLHWQMEDDLSSELEKNLRKVEAKYHPLLILASTIALKQFLNDSSDQQHFQEDSIESGAASDLSTCTELFEIGGMFNSQVYIRILVISYPIVQSTPFKDGSTHTTHIGITCFCDNGSTHPQCLTGSGTTTIG